METTVCLAVNGTLMRGLELNGNMTLVGAQFVREALTEPAYRLWSIGDRYPAMMRVQQGGVSVAVEIWSVPASGIGALLLLEPPGLAIGKVRLVDGEEVLGVLGEAFLCEGQKEITRWQGWRAYIAHLENNKEDTVMSEKRVDAAEFVEQMAAVIGLPLQPDHQPGVVDNVTRIIALAQLVAEFPLPEEIEIAPVFQP
jgi:gamma-glutamylcyclotransferase (GGCT)/AIG2-like uncharacterized protein YtfP